MWEAILSTVKSLLPTLLSGAVQAGVGALSSALAPTPRISGPSFSMLPSAAPAAPAAPKTGVAAPSLGQSFTGGYTGGAPMAQPGEGPGVAPSTGFTTLSAQRQMGRPAPTRGYETI